MEKHDKGGHNLARKKTLYLEVVPQALDLAKIHRAANLIKKGGIVAFPTETVYGLCADAMNPKAVMALFKAKKRPLDNPPIVHVGDPEDVKRLAASVPNQVEKLIERFWPGPLTLVFRRSETVPAVSVAGLDTIAVRMPKHEVALSLIRESECPISAPSANLSGKPSPTTAFHVLQDLRGRIDAVLDSGPTRIGVESTVLDVTSDPPIVLRPGGTAIEDLRRALGKVRLHKHIMSEGKQALRKARSPGMMYKHYAPNAKLILVEGALNLVIEKITQLLETYKTEGVSVGVLATDETAIKYHADLVISLGSRFSLDTVASNLFASLRKFDSAHVDVIIAESVPMEGLGLAVMNRLRKASTYNIIKV